MGTIIVATSRGGRGLSNQRQALEAQCPAWGAHNKQTRCQVSRCTDWRVVPGGGVAEASVLLVHTASTGPEKQPPSTFCVVELWGRSHTQGSLLSSHFPPGQALALNVPSSSESPGSLPLLHVPSLQTPFPAPGRGYGTGQDGTGPGPSQPQLGG